MHASVHGLRFPMSYGEYLQLALTRRVVGFLRNSDEPAPELVTPWPVTPLVSDEELAALEALLEKRSAIP